MNVEKLEKAIFAGGCFWCLQQPFDELKGVASTIVGYTGGHTTEPTYDEVCSGKTGHTEAIEILYDSSEVTYQELLDVFWTNIDPTASNRQFSDVGSQYRTAVFYQNEEQRRLAEASKQQLERSGQYDTPIVTEILPASKFYPAEAHHQHYYKNYPIRYKFYRHGSGRDQFLQKIWDKKNSK